MTTNLGPDTGQSIPPPRVPIPVTSATFDDLRVRVFADREALGRYSAARVAGELHACIARQGHARVVFAAAPSQTEFLASLVEERDVDWSCVDAFHMDEYLGLNEGAPESFGTFLRKRIFDRLPFRAVHLLRPDAADPAAECRRYEALLREAPIDLVCLGIGENGHLAFNDPGVADFDDPAWVKPVEIDDVSRMQQVHDGCFAEVKNVPRRALTLTIPALCSAAFMPAIVPGSSKARAVERALFRPISTTCPASVLRRYATARLYLDVDAAESLTPLRRS